MVTIYNTTLSATSQRHFSDSLGGGVPEVSKTDNMLQWVKRYDRYEPALNEAAEKWAMHYGTDIEGCRSRKPRDKGPAEGLVAKVYQFYYSRIYNETWTSLEELNNRIFELNDLYNNRIKSGLTLYMAAGSVV